MKMLSKPSTALAARLHKEVGFEERLIGTKMSPKAGNRICSIYSFEEATRFFDRDAIEELLNVGGGSSLAYIDLEKLSDWVADIFKDKELSDRITKEIRKSSSYVEKAKAVRRLMEERLAQCKEIDGLS